MQAMVQPLRDLLDSLTEEEARRQMRLNDALKRDEGSDQELEDIEIELEQCNQTTARYTDCSRIVKGITQRYLTKYLRVRLKELLETERENQVVRRKDIYDCRKVVRQAVVRFQRDQTINHSLAHSIFETNMPAQSLLPLTQHLSFIF